MLNIELAKLSANKHFKDEKEKVISEVEKFQNG